MTSGTEEPLLTPVWAKRFFALVGILTVVFLLVRLQDALLPFLVAWIAAYVVTPLVDVMERRLKIRREQGVVAVMIMTVGIVIVFVATAIPIIVSETMGLVNRLPGYRIQIMEKIELYRASGRIHPVLEEAVGNVLQKMQESAPAMATQAGQWLLSRIGSLIGILDFLLNFLLFLFLFYYFLRDFHEINDLFLKATPRRYRKAAGELMKEMDSNLRTVLRGQFLVAVAMSALYCIGLLIIGVPYAILIGIVSGMGNFLPYLGPLLGMIPAFLFLFLHATDLNSVLIPAVSILVVFGVVQFVESFILTPHIAGKSVGLGPVAVLFALSVGGVLFGIVGVVAALPMAAISKVLVERGWEWYTHSRAYRGASSAED